MWQIPDAVHIVACAPDDGWWYHPKHVEQFPDKLCNVASFWIYIGILLQCTGPWTLNPSLRLFTKVPSPSNRQCGFGTYHQYCAYSGSASEKKTCCSQMLRHHPLWRHPGHGNVKRYEKADRGGSMILKWILTKYTLTIWFRPKYRSISCWSFLWSLLPLWTPFLKKNSWLHERFYWYMTCNVCFYLILYNETTACTLSSSKVCFLLELLCSWEWSTLWRNTSLL